MKENTTPNLTPQRAEEYAENFRKYENNEWSCQQWTEYCTMLLAELMEANKDVLIRLKNR
jgi:hypothetical protein